MQTVPTFDQKMPLQRALGRVLAIASSLLLIPAVAMQLTREVNWGPGDFLAAFLLIAGTGTAWVLLSRKLVTKAARTVAGMILGAALLLVWAELAVGLLR